MTEPFEPDTGNTGEGSLRSTDCYRGCRTFTAEDVRLSFLENQNSKNGIKKEKIKKIIPKSERMISKSGRESLYFSLSGNQLFRALDNKLTRALDAVCRNGATRRLDVSATAEIGAEC